MKFDQILLEYYFHEKDNLNKAELSHVRRPRLTLKKLGKMRRVRDLRRFEEKERIKRLPQIYGASDSDGM
jgi:hypothetical protein